MAIRIAIYECENRFDEESREDRSRRPGCSSKGGAGKTWYLTRGHPGFLRPRKGCDASAETVFEFAPERARCLGIPNGSAAYGCRSAPSRKGGSSETRPRQLRGEPLNAFLDTSVLVAYSMPTTNIMTRASIPFCGSPGTKSAAAHHARRHAICRLRFYGTLTGPPIPLRGNASQSLCTGTILIRNPFRTGNAPTT